MIRLEMEIDNIDYDSLVEKLMPIAGDKLAAKYPVLKGLAGSGAAGGAAKLGMKMMSQEKKDQLAVNIINDNRKEAVAMIENRLKESGIKVDILSVTANEE